MRLSTDQRGNAAMMFALAIIPIMVFALAAIDFNRRETYSRDLRTAVDAATVSAARFMATGSPTDDEIEAVALAMFNKNFESNPAISLDAPVVDPETGAVRISISGTIDTTVSGIIGFDTMQISASAKAGFGDGEPVEAVLVLDTSYSMTGDKLTDLRTAAQSFVDKVITDGSDQGKVGIVPFSHYVNVGTANAGEAWINVPAEWTETHTHCSIPSSAYEDDDDCTLVSSACARDGVPSTCHSWSCTPGAGPDADDEVCTTSTRTYRWYGCVASRHDPFNLQDGFYNAQVIEARMTPGNWGCPKAITPLSSSKTDLSTAITALSADGDTYIPTGLMWGLRALSSVEPFSEGTDETAFEAAGGRRVLILMSDGANTRSQRSSDGLHEDWDVNAANTVTDDACDEVKDANIELYTIAFDVTDTDLKTRLEDCASDAGKFFDAADADDLLDAFNAIGGGLRVVSLSD